MYDLKTIMNKAWAIFNARRAYATFRDCLKMAWAAAKGFTHCFQVSYVDANRKVTREIGFGKSYDAVRTHRIVQQHTYLATGLRSISSNEFGLGAY